MFIPMTIKAGLWVASGVVDKNPLAAACLDMFAPGAMTRFASADTMVTGVVFEKSGMDTAMKGSCDIFMTIDAFLIAHIMGTVNFWRDDDRIWKRRTRGREGQRRDD